MVSTSWSSFIHGVVGATWPHLEQDILQHVVHLQVLVARPKARHMALIGLCRAHVGRVTVGRHGVVDARKCGSRLDGWC